jgi:two-component system chemotaxis sensor kinase CheA
VSLDLEQFHDVFFQESFEALDAMEQTLLQLNDDGSDPEQINTIFRVAHSIKGGAATFGFNDVTSFTHTVETLLDLVRNGRVRMSQKEVDLLLRSVDVMRDMLAAVQDKRTADPAQFRDIQQAFEETIRANTGRKEAAEPAAFGLFEEPAKTAAVAASGWSITLKPRPMQSGAAGDLAGTLERLAGLGELALAVDAASLPPLAELDPARCHLQWKAELRGAIARADIEAALAPLRDAVETTIEGGETEPSAASAAASSQPNAAEAPHGPAKADHEAAPAAHDAPRHGSEASSIRVSIEKLDELINTVGELVITQSILSQVAADMGGPRADELKNGIGQLERQMRALQEGVMRVRMLPISFVFNRFPRMVRDLGQRLGKRVELRMTGEHTELDKTVLEKIGDPLVHLLRNSIDHGIEDPERRVAAGKPAAGTVQLNAYHKGGNIIVEIIDDGAGLDRSRILAKARDRGLIAPDEEPSEDRIYNLVFQPGFSTAEVVSDVSGRGVGMDVVRRNIVELGGNVQIFSNAGQGCTVRIRLPLTLAILDGQLVRVGCETYVIPLVSIVETIQVRKDQINSVAGCAELFRLRNDYIPIIRLYELFDVQPDTTDLLKGLLTIVESDGQRAGIFVDELQAQQQVVIKSLETNFRQLIGVSGATMLGDGHVALILDVPGLIARFESEAGAARRPAAA